MPRPKRQILAPQKKQATPVGSYVQSNAKFQEYNRFSLLNHLLDKNRRENTSVKKSIPSHGSQAGRGNIPYPSAGSTKEDFCPWRFPRIRTSNKFCLRPQKAPTLIGQSQATAPILHPLSKAEYLFPRASHGYARDPKSTLCRTKRHEARLARRFFP